MQRTTFSELCIQRNPTGEIILRVNLSLYVVIYLLNKKNTPTNYTLAVVTYGVQIYEYIYTHRVVEYKKSFPEYVSTRYMQKL